MVGADRLTSDLHYLPATEALRMFRARELSPVELMKAVIARVEGRLATLTRCPVEERWSGDSAGPDRTSRAPVRSVPFQCVLRASRAMTLLSRQAT